MSLDLSTFVTVKVDGADVKIKKLSARDRLKLLAVVEEQMQDIPTPKRWLEFINAPSGRTAVLEMCWEKTNPGKGGEVHDALCLSDNQEVELVCELSSNELQVMSRNPSIPPTNSAETMTTT